MFISIFWPAFVTDFVTSLFSVARQKNIEKIFNFFVIRLDSLLFLSTPTPTYTHAVKRNSFLGQKHKKKKKKKIHLNPFRYVNWSACIGVRVCFFPPFFVVAY